MTIFHIIQSSSIKDPDTEESHREFQSFFTMHISNTRFVHSISVQIFIYEFLSKQLDRRSFSRTLFTSSQRNDTSSNSKYSWSSDALSRWSQKLKERSPLLENVEFLFSILLFHGETTVHFQIIIGSIDLDQTPNLLIAKFHSRDDTQQRMYVT